MKMIEGQREVLVEGEAEAEDVEGSKTYRIRIRWPVTNAGYGVTERETAEPGIRMVTPQIFFGEEWQAADDSDVVQIEVSLVSIDGDCIVYDSGASISIFNDYGGHEKIELPRKTIMTGNGRIVTTSGFVHPLFGLVYVYEKLPVKIVSAYEITHNERYQIVTYPDGTLDVYDADGTVFYVRWKKSMKWKKWWCLCQNRRK